VPRLASKKQEERSMKKYAAVLMREICGSTDAKWFADCLTEKTAAGFEVENCGVTDSNVAWAIFTKPVEPEKPAEHKSEAWDWLEQNVLERYRKESDNDFGLSEVEHAWQMALDYVQEARRRAGR
jgi:hypothetical protein